MTRSDDRLRWSAFLTLVLVACATSGPGSEPHPARVFFDTLRISGGSVSSDGTRLLVSTNESGKPQVGALSVHGGPVEQLTQAGEDSQFAVGWFRHDDRFLFRSDKGGDERDHIYLQQLDGAVVDLTPAPECKANFHGWQRDGQAFFIATNERDPKFFDLYRYDVPEGSAANLERTMVFENTGGFQLGPVDGSGTKLAVGRAKDNKDSDSYLVDLTSGASDPVLLTEHEGSAQFRPQTFSPDSRFLYVISDLASEFTRLWAIELETLRRTVTVARDWDVQRVSFSRDERYRILTIDADARTVLEVTRADSGQPVRLPAVADGRTIVGFETSADGALWILRVAGDTSPGDFFVCQRGGDDLRQLTQALPAKLESGDLVAGQVVRYRSGDGLEIPAILYRPHGSDASHRAPAIVRVHGGPGGQSRVSYDPTNQFLLSRGYAVLAVNNRGSSGYGKTFFHSDDRKHGEADLDDCVAARGYLAGLDWVDGGKVAILGGSYGGYMVAAALAFRPDAFDAGIDIFGVTNWVRTLESIPPWWEAARDSLYAELGDPATDGERLRRISPLFHADRITKPLLVVQGANDPRVLQVESDELVEAVRSNGVPVEYIVFRDEGHGFEHRVNQITAAVAYVRFLDSHLLGKHAAQ